MDQIYVIVKLSVLEVWNKCKVFLVWDCKQIIKIPKLRWFGQIRVE